MTYYFTNQSQIINVSNAKQFVELTRLDDAEQTSNNKEFMEMYAIRKFTLKKIIINTVSEERFLESLIQNGIFRKKNRKNILNHILHKLKL